MISWPNNYDWATEHGYWKTRWRGKDAEECFIAFESNFSTVVRNYYLSAQTPMISDDLFMDWNILANCGKLYLIFEKIQIAILVVLLNCRTRRRCQAFTTNVRWNGKNKISGRLHVFCYLRESQVYKRKTCARIKTIFFLAWYILRYARLDLSNLILTATNILIIT